MNTWTVLNIFSEDKLPDKCKFFSFLKDEYISEKDYLKAIDVWNVFKMNTMGDHHDLYSKTDVLLLLMFLKSSLIHAYITIN